MIIFITITPNESLCGHTKTQRKQNVEEMNICIYVLYKRTFTI
jgi:hypothetical protein